MVLLFYSPSVKLCGVAWNLPLRWADPGRGRPGPGSARGFAWHAAPCWKWLSRAQPCLPPPPPQPRRSVSCLLWLHLACFLCDAPNRSGPGCLSSPVLPPPFLPPQHKSAVAFALPCNCYLLLFARDWVTSCSKYAGELAVSHLQGRHVKGLRVCSSSVDVLLLGRVI